MMRIIKPQGDRRKSSPGFISSPFSRGVFTVVRRYLVSGLTAGAVKG
jgi:hypothetical protein